MSAGAHRGEVFVRRPAADPPPSSGQIAVRRALLD